MNIVNSLRKNGHSPSLFASFLYFDVSFMIWVILGALGVYITKDFNLSPAEKGLIVSIPTLAGSFFRIILGILTDRIGPRQTAMGGMLITSIPLLWGFFFGNSIPELILIGVLLGIAGASFSVALPMASRWYPPHLQGLAMGIAGAGNSGTVLATLFGPRIAEHIGWHGVMGVALIPLFLTFIVYCFIAKNPPNQPKPEPIKNYFKVFKLRDTWFFCFLYSVTFGGFVGLTNFLSIFFVDQYRLSSVKAGDFVTFLIIAGSFSRPVAGYIADKVGGTKLLSYLFIILTICMFGVSTLPPLAMIVALLFIGMLCLGMGNGAVFQVIPQRFQKEIGVITGVVGAAGGVGGFFVPNLLGTLNQITGTNSIGFMIIAVVVVTAWVLLLFVQRSWKKSTPIKSENYLLKNKVLGTK